MDNAPTHPLCDLIERENGKFEAIFLLPIKTLHERASTKALT